MEEVKIKMVNNEYIICPKRNNISVIDEGDGEMVYIPFNEFEELIKAYNQWKANYTN